MNTKSPLITVIMSVYNTDTSYLSESINSILGQTFTNFEFLIVDDCCQGRTKIELEQYEKADSRICLIHNSENLGLTKSLNIMLKRAKGEYIARMDADDISKPERLQKQLDYMKSHPQYAVIGCKFRITGRRGVSPTDWNDDMSLRKIHLLFYNDGICHPCAFFQTSFLRSHQLEYDPVIKKSQDYAMWLAIADAGGKIGLCPEVLFTYRVHSNQISKAGYANQMQYEQMTIRKQLDRLDPNLTESDRQIFYSLYRGEISEGEQKLYLLLKQLIEINKQKKIYASDLFIAEIKKIWKTASLKQIKKEHRFNMLLMTPVINRISENG